MWSENISKSLKMFVLIPPLRFNQARPGFVQRNFIELDQIKHFYRKLNLELIQISPIFSSKDKQSKYSPSTVQRLVHFIKLLFLSQSRRGVLRHRIIPGRSAAIFSCEQQL